jgi:hypothetical protein
VKKSHPTSNVDYLQMNLWLFPFDNPILNTVIRGFSIALIAVYAFRTSWYNGYWLAVIHDIISLVLIRDLVTS